MSFGGFEALVRGELVVLTPALIIVTYIKLRCDIGDVEMTPKRILNERQREFFVDELGYSECI